MTDSNTPAGAPTPPSAEQPYGAPPAQQPYGASPAQPYASAPPPAYGPPAQQTVPGKTLGIVAFVLSFFMQIVALVLGIVALVQSRKTGHKNGFALAAIIISAVLFVIGVIVAIAIITISLGAVAAACADLGPGVWELTNGGTITCD